MSAPRIDTTRNIVDSLILLLADFRDEVHDINDLAYNRNRAAEESRVNGGSRDYALDTHGDMIARKLYTAAVVAFVKAANPLEDAVKALRSHLTAGGSVSGYDKAKTAPKAEVAKAVNAAKRRRDRGEQWETVHHLIADQPFLAYLEPTEELDNLRNALRKMCRGVKPDRSRLTPGEQEAWRRAVTLEAKAG